MAKDFERINILMDFYGDMLTERQHTFLNYYYFEDLSLSEIAENEGITRQGVRDSIKRAESQLLEMEEKLGHAKRFIEIRDGLNEILKCAEVINNANMHTALSRDINDAVTKIKFIAENLGNDE